MDIITALVEDHNQIKRIFTEYEMATTDAAKESIFNRVRHAVVVHDPAEQLRFWPEVRHVIPEGEELVSRCIDEEDKLKHLLAKLERMKPNQADWDPLFEEFKHGVLQHAKDEEHRVFPKVQRSFDADALERMGAQFAAAKQATPTHAHPLAPNTPPGNLVLGPPGAILDRIRDAAGHLFAKGS